MEKPRTDGHIAQFVVLPGRRDEAVRILEAMFAQVPREPGTLVYVMHLSNDDPNVIWFYERYRDHGAFAVHSSSETHDRVLAAILPLLDPAWRVHWADLVFGKGLGGGSGDWDPGVAGL